jgi:site-specific DNA recombinase
LSDHSRAADKLHHNLNLAVSQYHVDNLSEEVKKGMNEKTRQGGWAHKVPVGYINNLKDHTIEIDPINGPLVKKAFELAASGQYSLRALCEKTYKLGLRGARSGKKYSKQSMERLLKHPIHYGYIRWKGQIYKGNHIIDEQFKT